MIRGIETLDDAEIVDLYWQRNEIAVEHTQLKYGSLCSSISNNILRNHWDVEECLNDMYNAAWNTIPPQRPNSLKMYVCKLIRCISINKATYNNADKRDKRKTVSFEEIETELQKSFVPELVTDDSTHLTEVINEYLSCLPEKKRTIVVLRYWHCMSLVDIAKRTGININTVKTILSREVRNMKHYFEKEGVYASE